MDQAHRYELADIDRVAVPMMVKAFVFYELPLTVDPESLIGSINEGLANATLHCPFIAGDVQADESGKLHIATSPKKSVKCTIRHFAPTEHKSFEALSRASFSPADFNPDQLLPELPAGEKPVCALQLNFIENGLILGFTMNHSAGDWASMRAILALICQGSKAHQHRLSMPTYHPDLNRGAYNSHPQAGLTQDEMLQKCPGFYVLKPGGFTPQTPPPFQTSIYRISESAISQLKKRCTPLPEGVDYISSYDCLSALLWVSITRARVQVNPEKATSQSRFMHPIDLRTRDRGNVTSSRYFGNAIYPSQVGPISAKSLLSEDGLIIASSSIRKSINPVGMDSISNITALVGSLAPTERLGYHADFHDMDVLVNSWYPGDVTDFDIGSGSLPHAFRPHRPITGACCLILPNFRPSGPRVYEVFLQLEVQQHELLRRDEEFLGYFEIAV